MSHFFPQGVSFLIFQMGVLAQYLKDGRLVAIVYQEAYVTRFTAARS